MLNLAEAWGLRTYGGNPCRFVQKYKEKRRERFLSEGEFARLGRVLAEVEEEGAETPAAVAAIRLLMLTGSGLVKSRRCAGKTSTWMQQSCGCAIPRRAPGWSPSPTPRSLCSRLSPESTGTLG